LFIFCSLLSDTVALNAAHRGVFFSGTFSGGIYKLAKGIVARRLSLLLLCFPAKKRPRGRARLQRFPTLAHISVFFLFAPTFARRGWTHANPTWVSQLFSRRPQTFHLLMFCLLPFIVSPLPFSIRNHFQVARSVRRPHRSDAGIADAEQGEDWSISPPMETKLSRQNRRCSSLARVNQPPLPVRAPCMNFFPY